MKPVMTLTSTLMDKIMYVARLTQKQCHGYMAYSNCSVNEWTLSVCDLYYDKLVKLVHSKSVAYPGILFNKFSWGQNAERKGVWGRYPLVRGPLSLQMSETRILSRLLRMYFPRNWEFGSVLSKLRNFGGCGVETPTPTPLGTPLQ
jgi:hypothetical protein